MSDDAERYQSLLETVPCNLCGADDYEVIYPPRYDATRLANFTQSFRSSGDEILIDQLVRCRQCRLQYLNPRPRQELILEAYSLGTDEVFVSQAAARERTFARCLDMIEHATPERGCILDIGTAGGSFLHVCKQRGWLVAGCEPNRWLCEWGNQHYGIKIHPGTIFDMELNDASFDVVTLWDVLEHTPSPKAVLMECHRVLKPGGLLVVNYPDVNSLVARLMGRKWVFLLSVHLYYFTPETIRNILKLTGFQMVKYQRHWQSLELGYIFFRMEPYIALAARLGKKATNAFHMQNTQIPYWMGQVLVMARRSLETQQERVEVRDKQKVVVLGAGVGGLATGYFLARTGKYKVTVLEKEPLIGGLSSSFEHAGFVLDYGPHKIYSVIPGLLDEIQTLMGERLLKVPKRNRLFMRGYLVDYPLRLGNLARVLGPAVFLRLGSGYLVPFVRGLIDKRPARSYEEYMVKRFGRPAYELVFEPLADKVWGNPSELHPEMASTRVPASGGLEVILKLLKIKKETAETSAELFYYPRRGFGDLPQTLSQQIEAMGGKVIVNADVSGLEKAGKRVTAVTGTIGGQPASFPCDYLISSISLSELGRLVFDDTDREFNRAVEELEFRHLILVYIFVKRPLVLEDQWLFFPERQFIFSRISEQKQMNPEAGPPDSTAICCDFTCAEDGWQWKASDEELMTKCVEGLVAGGFIEPDEVTGYLVKRTRSFYPRYDLCYAEKMETVSHKLQQVENLLLTGRIGMYNYNNADHCTDMGRFIAQNLAGGHSPKDIWDALEQRVKVYKIVD